MDRLLELGINEFDLKNMLYVVPNIVDMSDKEIDDKIDILKYVGCNDRHIKNIIISIPGYLDRVICDLLKLINYLNTNGFSNLNLLFDSNPYFLNYDVFEVRNYINKQINLGKNMTDIIDEIESNPYVMDYE